VEQPRGEVLKCFKALGLDLHTDLDLLWIAKKALAAKHPHGPWPSEEVPFYLVKTFV